MSECRKLIESLLIDLRSLSTEAKKKHPHVKEAADSGVVKVRNIASSHQDEQAILNGLTRASQEILHPLLLGCSSRNPKIVHICLQAIQKLVAHKTVDSAACSVVVNELWSLMENECEELRVLQTTTLMAGSLPIVRGHLLARCLVLCFRLNFAKESTVINTASASVRQLVGLVFDRTVTEDNELGITATTQSCVMKGISKTPPKNMAPAAADAFMLFQDMCLLVNADSPVWLVGMTEMTRTLGLELMESTLVHYSSVFQKHPEMQFILKEQVCPLVIKLFSPNLKYIQAQANPSSRDNISPTVDKPYFPIAIRLLRLVSVLITTYYHALVTESEIFLSLILKFLDSDKLCWQRALALEVLHRIVAKPKLMKSICENYDMKTHATKIVQEMVNGISGFVQTSFLNRDQTNNLRDLLVADSSVANDSAISQSQPGFLYRNVWIPLTFIAPQSTPKSLYLELVDKHEAPPLPEGYCLSLAYTCLLDTMHSITDIVREEKDTPLCTQIINSTHCALLTSFQLLLEASADENITESLLKSLSNLLSMACDLDISEVREGVVSQLCRAALPNNYMVKVMATQGFKTNAFNGTRHNNSGGVGDTGEGGPGQVVAVSTPCPTPNISQTVATTQVMLTAKNLQAVRSVLEIANIKGQLLKESWNVLLLTLQCGRVLSLGCSSKLQHLTWMLGIRCHTDGSLQSGQCSADSNTVLTTAVMADLPLLTNMVNSLFQHSNKLDEVALHQVMAALCQQSNECMHVASQQQREPSLFPLAKIVHTATANLHRLNIIWKLVTGHFIEVCSHQFTRLREWAAAALTTLINAAFDSETLPNMPKRDLHLLMFSPVTQLSHVPFDDVRKKQLDCIMHILHAKGQALDPSVWTNVLSAIVSVVDGDTPVSEGLVGEGHDAVQLLITDLLICLPHNCIAQLIQVDAKFGAHNKQLNISLSAVGQLWTISDFLYRNRSKFIGKDVQSMWLCLFTCLGDLCVDTRPPVRKSACHTLLQTITCHGHVLETKTWQTIIWKVLFPMIDKVFSLANQASTTCLHPDSLGGQNMLIHHSRDTESKQWAETCVHTLHALIKIFTTNTIINELLALDDFSKAWDRLLSHVGSACVHNSNEISLAALKNINELVGAFVDDPNTTNPTKPTTITAPLWLTVWKVWLDTAGVYATSDQRHPPPPNHVVALLSSFDGIFAKVTSVLDPVADLNQWSQYLSGLMRLPVAVDHAPFILPTHAEMSPAHHSGLNCINSVFHEVICANSKMRVFLPSLIKLLLEFCSYTVTTPKNELPVAEWVHINCIAFAEQSIRVLVEYYGTVAHFEQIIKAGTLTYIVRTLALPMAMKYSCPSQSSWKLACSSLQTILRIGLPIARKNPNQFRELWPELASVIDKFLFPSQLPSTPLPCDERKRHELIDCQIVDLLNCEVLPYVSILPEEFVTSIINTLNKGSISPADKRDVLETDKPLKLRSEFSKACFDSLLSMSQGEPDLVQCSSKDATCKVVVGGNAIKSLLTTCKQVLIDYVVDEKLSGTLPLPQQRIHETIAVLNAVTTLVNRVSQQPNLRSEVCHIYPSVVQCVACNNLTITQALIPTLAAFGQLL